ncbi:MAG: polyphosphate kinase, partial [Gaiellales bacterium]|nr:polyphosphate kinase [Gaiellales bacterium]
MTTTQRPQADAPGELLLNRELSWLDLNARVLDLASDPNEPLLERVKFCSIFSSNLDEFFMVRVAGLLDQVASGLSVRSADGRSPHQALTEIRARALDLVSEQSRLWRDDLCPALAAEGIVLGSVSDATPDEREQLEDHFARQIFPVLTPLAVGPGQPFPYISGLSLSLGVIVRDPESDEVRFARVKVPEGLSRWVGVGDRGLSIPLESVIEHFLSWLFPEMEIMERAAFRLTRDGDTEISDDADDLLEAVESELRKRRFGAVVRLEVSSSISRMMLSRLEERLLVARENVYPIRGLLDLADLGQLYTLDRPDLKYEPWVPFTQRRLASPANGDLFEEIGQRDLVVQHPYDSFATSVESFVRAAAKDPRVLTLKTTVYRTSHDSALAPALIQAAENGKQSVCVVELKARFDEQRNIEWARSLEQAGVHVVYGFPDMKIHAKTTLVIRREGDELRRYVHIGTGNYHATTARIYEDVGIFTADPAIVADVADLFNFVTGFGRPQRFRKILVAPFNLRRRLIEHIRDVAQAAEKGKRARIRLKVNNLTDTEIVEELYKASQAGIHVDIVVR